MGRTEEQVGESPATPLIGRHGGGGCGGLKAEEVKKQVSLGGPLVAINVLQYCLQVISVAVVGHQSELVLSGVSMANSFAQISGLSVLMGLSGALDTLCGQSYGAKLHNMLGIHTQRAMFVLEILCIPLSFVWTRAGSILIFLGQNQSVSEIAGSYIKFMIPGLFGYALLQCLNRFLTSQNKVFPLLLCSAFTTLLHIPVCWGLVFKFGLGVRGAALALSLSYWINVMFLSIYIKFSSACAKSWNGFSRESLKNFSMFFQLAVPSAIMVCLTLWSSETMVFLSGLLPNAILETSVFSTCLAIATIVRMIPYASTAVISVRVSNELGAERANAALRAMRVCFAMTLVACVLISSGLVIARKTLGYLYSNEVEVVKHVAAMIPLLSISYILDGVQCILTGVLSGSGWQKVGAIVNLGSYYLVGIPLAALFGFVLHVGAMVRKLYILR